MDTKSSKSTSIGGGCYIAALSKQKRSLISLTYSRWLRFTIPNEEIFSGRFIFSSNHAKRSWPSTTTRQIETHLNAII